MTAIGRIIAVGLPLILAGCGSHPDIAGKWVGYRPYHPERGQDPVVARTLAKVELRVDEKDRFVLFERGLPKSGELSYSGSGAQLHIREVAGQPIERQPPDLRDFGTPEVRLTEEGTLLYTDSKLPGPPVVLRRESQPGVSTVRTLD